MNPRHAILGLDTLEEASLRSWDVRIGWSFWYLSNMFWRMAPCLSQRPSCQWASAGITTLLVSMLWRKLPNSSLQNSPAESDIRVRGAPAQVIQWVFNSSITWLVGTTFGWDRNVEIGSCIIHVIEDMFDSFLISPFNTINHEEIVEFSIWGYNVLVGLNEAFGLKTWWTHISEIFSKIRGSHCWSFKTRVSKRISGWPRFLCNFMILLRISGSRLKKEAHENDTVSLIRLWVLQFEMNFHRKLIGRTMFLHELFRFYRVVLTFLRTSFGYAIFPNGLGKHSDQQTSWWTISDGLFWVILVPFFPLVIWEDSYFVPMTTHDTKEGQIVSGLSSWR